MYIDNFWRTKLAQQGLSEFRSMCGHPCFTLINHLPSVEGICWKTFLDQQLSPLIIVFWQLQVLLLDYSVPLESVPPSTSFIWMEEWITKKYTVYGQLKDILCHFKFPDSWSVILRFVLLWTTLKMFWRNVVVTWLRSNIFQFHVKRPFCSI